MAILPKAIYRFSAIPIKNTIAFFNELEQIVLKFIWNHKRPLIAKAILRRKNKAGGLASQLQALLQSHSNQDNLVWHKSRPIDQWNKIESPDINPTIYGKLTYDKGAMDIQFEKSAFLTTGGDKTGQLHVRE